LFIKTANIDVTKDFPTPPFPLAMAITFFMLLPLCGFSLKSCGSVLSEQFELQEEQLCEHSAIIFSHKKLQNINTYIITIFVDVSNGRGKNFVLK